MITVPNYIVFDEVKKHIGNGERITIPLRGTSMLPTLHEGDLLTLAPVDGHRKFDKNDVLLFHYNGMHILHRFHHYEGNTIVTRGDHLYSFERFTETDIVAILQSFTDKNGITTRCDSMRWKIATLQVPLVRFGNYCARKFKKHILRQS